MIALEGLISMVFFEDMYALEDESRRAWAFMMRSMLADQPYLVDWIGIKCYILVVRDPTEHES